MEFVQRVRKTDLARNTRRVIDAVQRGQTALIENHGELEAAIIDIGDYRILRAVMRYHARQSPPPIDPEAGLPEQEVEAIEDIQARHDLVMAHYLTGSISFGRAAELLRIPWLELRTRFLRLDVPLRTGPIDLAGAVEEVRAARVWQERE